MSKPFHCAKCGLFLGEMDKGRVRHGAVLLCGHCWGKAEVAMAMAELMPPPRESYDRGKGSGSDVVDDLMDMFNGKKG